MDLVPFLEVNMLAIRDSVVPELKMFCKSYFNSDEVFTRASALRYSNEIRRFFVEQLSEPSDEFVRLMISTTYTGQKRKETIDEFRPMVKATLKAYIEEVMRDRMLQSLKDTETDKQDVKPPEPIVEVPAEPASKIVTTDEEMQAFYIVKAILTGHEDIDTAKIGYKDTVHYFAVLFDDMPTKWICRLRLSGNKKYISLPGEQHEEVRTELGSIDNLYNFKDALQESVRRFLV